MSWGALATNEGWAQLPFLNVTAEGYVKAGIAEVPDNREPLLQGEAEFGNAGLAVEGGSAGRSGCAMRAGSPAPGRGSGRAATGNSAPSRSAWSTRPAASTASSGSAGPTTVADALPATDDYVAG